MAGFERPPPKDLAIAGGVAAGCAVLGAILLTSLGGPTNFKARVAKVEGDVGQAERLFRPGRNAETFGPDAICATGADAQASALRSTITTLSDQAGLKLGVVDTRPLGQDPTSRGLTPIRLRFEATGSYDAIVVVLDNLSRHKPEVFVDAVDLTTKASDVTLTFSGRVFCSA